MQPAPAKLIYNMATGTLSGVTPEEHARLLASGNHFQDASPHQLPLHEPFRVIKRIALIMTAWQRAFLTQKICEYYGSLKIEGYDVRLFVAVSPDEDPANANLTEYTNVVYAPNYPLNRKWNFAARRAIAAHDPDCIIIVGSDDLINADYIKTCARYAEFGCDRLDSCVCWFYGLKERRSSLLRAARVGAGRMISREGIERLRGQLWPSDDKWHGKAKTDQGQDAHWDEAGLKHIFFDPTRKPFGFSPRLVDIKTPGINRWAWSEFEPGKNPLCEPWDNRDLITHFPTIFEVVENTDVRKLA